MARAHALFEGWETMPYRQFLAQRRKLMAGVIRRWFESPSGEEEIEGTPADAGDVTFSQSKVGQRTLDFTTEGMVHIGLLPDWIEDIRRDGVSDTELEPLFKSAEGYIRMWEKAEDRGAALRTSGVN